MISTKDIQVPWLLAPEWKDFPLTKGLNHHRVPVGIILAANEEITVILTSEKLDSVQVRLLNNDSKTEGQFTIKSSLPGRSASLSTTSVSVPFIDCEYLDGIPTDNCTISVSYPSSSKILPIFRCDDNEDTFFELWDSEKAEFAYIESDYFGLLIPETDKEYARALPNGNHLKDLILFFDEIFTIYSRLIGLSFEETGINKNVRNRFFMKANKNGVGAAYYCDWCTAETSESVKSFWLDLSPTNWGALHEIGHGHELKCLSDETFSTGEVWNNVLVAFYQYIMMGDEIFTKGGLSREETKIDADLKIGKPVKEWGVFQKLSFLLHMFFRAGQLSFVRLNQLIRQECSGDSFCASGCAILEKLMFFFATDFGLDVYPFMKLAKATISDEKFLEYYYTFSEVAYPLNYLISDQKLLNSVKKKLNFFYDTSLVTPLDLRVTNLKGDFTLEIDKTIFRVLYGEMFKLMDGHRTVLERRILDQKILLKDIPIGVYKIFIPSNAKNYMFLYSDVYALVHANTPTVLTITAKTVSTSSLLHDKIKFLGLGDEHFASLSIDFVKDVIKFHVFSKDPHCYFSGEIYASIKIRNNKNEVVFSKVLEGTHCAIGLYQIPLKETLEIEIFHAETITRLKTGDPAMDVLINHESNTNVLYVSKLGFQNKQTPQMNLANSLLKRIDAAANKIRRQPCLIKRPYCHPKYNLFLAIKSFKYLFKDHPLSTDLEDKYEDCLHTDFSTEFVNGIINLDPGSIHKNFVEDDFYELTQISTGNKLILPNKESSFLVSKLKFLGLSDKHVGTLYIDAQKQIISFQVLSPNPHYRFEGEGYFGVIIRNNVKEVIFSKIIEGIDPTVEEYKISFSEKVEIDVFHAETISRLVSDNPDVYYMIDRESNINTFVISKQ